jgi:hypothetical protein
MQSFSRVERGPGRRGHRRQRKRLPPARIRRVLAALRRTLEGLAEVPLPFCTRKTARRAPRFGGAHDRGARSRGRRAYSASSNLDDALAPRLNAWATSPESTSRSATQAATAGLEPPNAEGIQQHFATTSSADVVFGNNRSETASILVSGASHRAPSSRVSESSRLPRAREASSFSDIRRHRVESKGGPVAGATGLRGSVGIRGVP